MITQERLKEICTYDPETGIFISLVSRGKGKRSLAGSAIGSPAKWGHIQLSLDGKTYGAHRLAWLYIYGSWPNGHIDHINRIPSDNRICNLRIASISENRCNTPGKKGKTLPKGVHWNRGRYLAQVSKDRVVVFSERFRSIEEAAEAARIARDRFHGEFSNHAMEP